MQFFINKMLIRRNNTLSRRSSQATTNELIPLREAPSLLSEEAPLVLLPSLTLNPESPITSVLVANHPSHPLFKPDREESEFSFKQGGLLTEEDPQQLEMQTKPLQQKPAIVINHLQESAESTQKECSEEGRQLRGTKAIGMITNLRQGSSHSRRQSSEKADSGVRKPLSNSLGSSRLEEVLNKIKSLRMGDTGRQESVRQSTMRHDESKVESTDASGEDSSPIKKQVISSIRKHVERMNFSLVKDHKIRQEESDSEEPSLLFKPQHSPIKPTPEDLLQSKNKSFLVRSTNKKSKRQTETVHISYKTSILQLKELSGRFDESMRVKVAVPACFSGPIFQHDDSQEELFDKAVGVLRELGAACLHPITIRKYSNCVLVMVDELALLSYFSGQVYFGGWEEGKSGMGLELMPGRCAYYGEFRNNKREGYGVLKEWQGCTMLGEWRGGKFKDIPLTCKVPL